MSNYKYKIPLLLCIGVVISQLTQAQQTVEGANTFLSQIVDDGHAKMQVIVTRLPIQRTYKYSKRGWLSTSVESQGTDEVLTNAFWESIKGSHVRKDGCLWQFTGSIKPTQFSWENDWRNSATDYIYEHNYTRAEKIDLIFDWGKLKVSRATHLWNDIQAAKWSDTDEKNRRIPGTKKVLMSVGANIRITPNNAKYGEVLQIRADDAMLDRIEYATKFLQMSCDRTASTGF